MKQKTKIDLNYFKNLVSQSYVPEIDFKNEEYTNHELVYIFPEFLYQNWNFNSQLTVQEQFNDLFWRFINILTKKV